MSVPAISVVLVTCNGAATLPAVLDAIRDQRGCLPFEVVAIDSASTDGTADLLRRRVDQFVAIPARAFDHGLTRNLGFERARGELVVLIVQDAVPASNAWLAALTAPLAADERIAGAYARQLPQPGASALTRRYLSQWVASSDVARTSAISSREELDALDPMAQLERCAFDNVCSCIRRSVWQQHPFRATPIAEDLEWAREVLLAGYRLAYEPGAAVVHSHDRSARYELRRTYVLHRRLYELFRLRTIPTLAMLGRAIASSLGIHLACQKGAREGAAATSRAIALAFAWPIGQYLGGLSAVRGWKIRPSRRV
jgi:rhamnosyltransferase